MKRRVRGQQQRRRRPPLAGAPEQAPVLELDQRPLVRHLQRLRRPRTRRPLRRAVRARPPAARGRTPAAPPSAAIRDRPRDAPRPRRAGRSRAAPPPRGAATARTPGSSTPSPRGMSWSGASASKHLGRAAPGGGQRRGRECGRRRCCARSRRGARGWRAHALRPPPSRRARIGTCDAAQCACATTQRSSDSIASAIARCAAITASSHAPSRKSTRARPGERHRGDHEQALVEAGARRGLERRAARPRGRHRRSAGWP